MVINIEGKIRKNREFPGFNSKKMKSKGDKNKEIFCWHFNRGKCSYGGSCKFEHRCTNCGKSDPNAMGCTEPKKAVVVYFN